MSQRTRGYTSIEMMRTRISLGKQIVDQVDPRYGIYAGIDPKTSLTLKNIDHFLKYKLIPDRDIALVEQLRDYYDEQRKALFATVGTDIFTKLSFIVGVREDVRSGTAKTKTKPSN